MSTCPVKVKGNHHQSIATKKQVPVVIDVNNHKIKVNKEKTMAKPALPLQKSHEKTWVEAITMTSNKRCTRENSAIIFLECLWTNSQTRDAFGLALTPAKAHDAAEACNHLLHQ